MIINKIKLLIFLLLIIVNDLSLYPTKMTARYDMLTLRPSQIHFPEVKNYSFQGGIYFYPSEKKFRYVSSIYDPTGQRIMEKVYNQNGKILQVVKYSYNTNGSIEKEEIYNQFEEVVKRIEYKSKNKNLENNYYPKEKFDLQEVHILNDTKEKYFIEYKYTYNDYLQIINKTEYIYDIKNKLSNDYLQINSIIYSYLNNTKIMEFYSKSFNQEEFKFKNAQIFEYIYPKKVHRVTYLDYQKNIKKIVLYDYDKNYRVKKVSVYHPKNHTKWKGFLTKDFKKDYTLKYFILYLYDENTFNAMFNQKSIEYKKFNLKEKKFKIIEKIKGPNQKEKLGEKYTEVNTFIEEKNKPKFDNLSEQEVREEAQMANEHKK